MGRPETEYCPRVFWYGPNEARSVQEKVRATVPLVRYRANGVRVNKKFSIWLCLKLYHLKSEPWRIGMIESVYRKALKTQRFISQNIQLFTREGKKRHEFAEWHVA